MTPFIEAICHTLELVEYGQYRSLSVTHLYDLIQRVTFRFLSSCGRVISLH